MIQAQTILTLFGVAQRYLVFAPVSTIDPTLGVSVVEIIDRTFSDGDSNQAKGQHHHLREADHENLIRLRGAAIGRARMGIRQMRMSKYFLPQRSRFVLGLHQAATFEDWRDPLYKIDKGPGGSRID